jgi:hypothetical protein
VAEVFFLQGKVAEVLQNDRPASRMTQSLETKKATTEHIEG